MPRKRRLHVPGALYHVVHRGNARQDLFYSASDRSVYYALIEESTRRFECQIHAFCLMTNHVHLALQVGKISLGRIMQNVLFRYARWFNYRYERVGHVFQGRYHAVLVDHDEYLLELVRYVHRNPVRAAMVEDPKAYPWSSHRAYLGIETIAWLATDRVLELFGQCRTEARLRYAEFMEAAPADPPGCLTSKESRDPRLAGGDGFVARLLREVGEEPDPAVSLDRLVGAVCSAQGLAEAELAASRDERACLGRALTALLAKDHGHAIAALARRLGRKPGSLKMGAARLRSRAQADATVRALIDDVETVLVTQAEPV